jgi:N-acetylglutamate synthase/N-acetylornithine aminotransferase
MDLAMESEYDIRRQGNLMVGKMALGSGIIRPESATLIKTQ